MKINGIKIKECKTEFLYRTLKSNRKALKLLPWCVLFFFACGILALCMVKDEELMMMGMFLSGLMFIMGFWSLWALSHTKKVNEEIINELDNRELTEEQIRILEEQYKNKSKDLVKSIFSGILIVIVVALLLYGFQSCSDNDDYYSDKYDEVFHKDPNTWTKEDKDYVNNLFDFIDENDNNK